MAHAFEPTTPARAAQAGVSGTVSVAVALDEHGKPQAARVVTSPSPLVNDTSLMAAMRSEFTPAIFRCRPVSGGYIYNVDYTS